MKVTKHTQIYRLGKHEQPVTIELDDGTLLDEVLLFDKKPTDEMVNISVGTAITRWESRQDEPKPLPPVPVEEIEAVLRMKGVLGINEKWDEWKLTPAAVAIKEK